MLGLTLIKNLPFTAEKEHILRRGTYSHPGLVPAGCTTLEWVSCQAAWGGLGSPCSPVRLPWSPSLEQELDELSSSQAS